MIAIAVDDEVLMLGALVKAIKASPDIAEVSQFSGCDEALAFVKENSVDVAFWILICVAWVDLHLQKRFAVSVPIAKSYFVPDMRNMQFPHLSSTPLDT